jgi:hypothetical protein
MRKIQKGLTIFTLVFFFVCFAAVTTAAEESAEYNPESNPVADVAVGPHGLTFQPKVEYGSLVLTVSKPDGEVISKSFASGTTPYLELAGDIIDGSYNYELTVIPKFVKRDRLSSVESKGPRDREARIQSGAFFVLGGRIVTPTGEAEVGIAKPLDQVILDDLIVDGSLCVGMDCVNGESFGFDTIRLKENNLRIRFVDTSSTSSFPSRDWQLTVNDSANGGANKFSIDDIDGGRTPFTIEAGAPSHSLYVDDGGRLGLGTSTPVVDAHIKTGNTPTLRLEQDGSSGFTPQTWDVAGNEANFFIRDATNGSTLPFRIQPGAPSSALSVMSDGKVGIGTWSPSSPIHLLTDSSTNADIVAERTGGAANFISAGGSFGFFGTTTDHPLRINVFGEWKMQLNQDDSLEMQSGATCTNSGVWTSVSSRELKENIRSLSIGEAMDTLESLNPVRFNYKVEKDEEYVGFIAEDVPELVAMKDRKHMTSMDVVAVLTKVAQEQQKLVQEQQKTISELKEKVAELEKAFQ